MKRLWIILLFIFNPSVALADDDDEELEDKMSRVTLSFDPLAVTMATGPMARQPWYHSVSFGYVRNLELMNDRLRLLFRLDGSYHVRGNASDAINEIDLGEGVSAIGIKLAYNPRFEIKGHTFELAAGISAGFGKAQRAEFNTVTRPEGQNQLPPKEPGGFFGQGFYLMGGWFINEDYSLGFDWEFLNKIKGDYPYKGWVVTFPRLTLSMFF